MKGGLSEYTQRKAHRLTFHLNCVGGDFHVQLPLYWMGSIDRY